MLASLLVIVHHWQKLFSAAYFNVSILNDNAFIVCDEPITSRPWLTIKRTQSGLVS